MDAQQRSKHAARKSEPHTIYQLECPDGARLHVNVLGKADGPTSSSRMAGHLIQVPGTTSPASLPTSFVS